MQGRSKGHGVEIVQKLLFAPAWSSKWQVESAAHQARKAALAKGRVTSTVGVMHVVAVLKVKSMMVSSPRMGQSKAKKLTDKPCCCPELLNMLALLPSIFLTGIGVQDIHGRGPALRPPKKDQRLVLGHRLASNPTPNRACRFAPGQHK